MKSFSLKGQYTLSLHYFGRKHPKNHLDLFLLPGYEKHHLDDKVLITYHISFDQWRRRFSQPIIAKRGENHRYRYLFFSGKVANGNNGKVRLLQHGKFLATAGFIQKTGNVLLRIGKKNAMEEK
ncbi:MAG: hypothetical protein D6767_02940 [Candidatus Hydrogenedentota bacterium]|nr:MAG: hypothetical protein D6767_02940 [Candidatus Hydrogenedentota bacterium]